MFSPATKILIVDDMMTMRKIVLKNLKELGYNCFIEAADGQKAWDILQDPTNRVQLIISDWNMPNWTGLDLLRKVRSDDMLKELPFIMLTAESEASQVMEAVGAGVDQYIRKPFTADALKEKMEATYKKRYANK